MNDLVKQLEELKADFKVDYSKELEVLEKEIENKMAGKLYKSSKEIEADIKKYNNLKEGKLVNYNYKKGVNVGVGAFIKGLLKAGLSNEDVLKQVHTRYGNENTTKACVSWYKNDMKKKVKVSEAVKVDFDINVDDRDPEENIYDHDEDFDDNDQDEDFDDRDQDEEGGE